MKKGSRGKGDEGKTNRGENRVIKAERSIRIQAISNNEKEGYSHIFACVKQRASHANRNSRNDR